MPKPPKPPQPPTIPDFVDSHRPRHELLERMRSMAGGGDRAQSFQRFQGHFRETAQLPPRPKTLLDMYLFGDVRQILQDAAIRKDHYEQRQHEILGALMTKTELDQPITDAEKNELFLTWLRDTEAAKATKERNAKITDPKGGVKGGDDIVLEDGRTLNESMKDARSGATFEKQDYGDQIII